MKFLLGYIAFCLTVDMMYIGCKLVHAWRKAQTQGREGPAKDPARTFPETESAGTPKE